MKRKVVQIVRSPVGGIRKHILSIIDGLGDDFDMYLITDISGGDKAYFENMGLEDNKCLKVFNLKINDQPEIRDVFNIFKILQIVRELSPEVLHGHGAKGGLYARLVGFFLNTIVVYTAHGGSVHDMHGKIKNNLYAIVEKLLYYLTDLLVFESKYTMGQYANKIGKDLSDKKFRLNYNAIEVPTPRIKCRDINAEGEIIIGSFGALRFIKGHDLLIKAVSRLIRKGYRIQLNIYGVGEERERLLGLISERNLLDSIKICNELESVDKEMKNCHIVVHPSRFESFGYVPLEALINGATVVSSLEGGLREVMDNGRSGFCTEDLDELSLEQQIEQAIVEKSKREHKFSHGISYLSKNFSSETFMQKLKGLYNDN